MRRDVGEGVKLYVNNEIRSNFMAIGKQFNVDYRTTKRAYKKTLNDERAQISQLIRRLSRNN